LVGVLICAGIPAGSLTTAQAVDDDPPVAVEDGSYPGADQIFEETGLRLLKGDGHLLWIKCTSSLDDSISVERLGGKRICFQALGRGGYLTLELPRVYGIRSSAGYSLTATFITDDETSTISVDPSSRKGIGKGISWDNGEATLVTLKAVAE